MRHVTCDTVEARQIEQQCVTYVMGFRLMVSCPGAEKEKVALCARQTKLKKHVAQSTPGQSGRIERQCVAE